MMLRIALSAIFIIDLLIQKCDQLKKVFTENNIYVTLNSYFPLDKMQVRHDHHLSPSEHQVFWLLLCIGMWNRSRTNMDALWAQAITVLIPNLGAIFSRKDHQYQLIHIHCRFGNWHDGSVLCMVIKSAEVLIQNFQI